LEEVTVTFQPVAHQHLPPPLQERHPAVLLKGIPEDVQVTEIVVTAMVVAANAESEASEVRERTAMIHARPKPKPPQRVAAITTKSAKQKALRKTIVVVVVGIETVVMTRLHRILPRPVKSLSFPSHQPPQLR
jgi:hypothetical protein